MMKNIKIVILLSLLFPIALSAQYNRSVGFAAGVAQDSTGWQRIGTNLSLLNSGDNVGVGTSSPSTALAMGNDKLFTQDVNSELTAGTTQTQAGGLALTAQVNDISVVANDNDAVVLPSLPTSGSLEILIINDDASGSNILQIFPASGDDLGSGVDASITLEVSESLLFTGVDATNWHLVSSTEIAHGEMEDTNNTDVFVINAANDAHVYHSNALVAGDLSGGWTFDAGGAGTSFPIASIADAGGGDITVTTTGAHGLAVGAIVSQTNLADAAYTGVFAVLTVPTTTTYTVTAVFTATGTGTMDEAATLTASALAVGTYFTGYSESTTTSSNNETLDFDIFLNVTLQGGGLRVRDKFGTAADFNAAPGIGLIDVESGDKISFCVSNNDSAGNITIRNLGIVLIRL